MGDLPISRGNIPQLEYPPTHVLRVEVGIAVRGRIPLGTTGPTFFFIFFSLRDRGSLEPWAPQGAPVASRELGRPASLSGPCPFAANYVG